MESVSCILCKNNNHHLLYEAQDYITGSMHTIVRCEKCNLVFVNPRPSKDEIGNYYPVSYYGEKPFTYENIDATNRFRTIKDFIRPGCRILDIGCGRGLVLDKCNKSGCEVWGTELSLTSSKYAKDNLNLNIINKELIDCSFKDDYFDIITMYHSLEHLTNPLDTIHEIHRILKPEGIVIIEVPRFNCWMSLLFKSDWFHLDIPRHLYHFEDDTLERILITSNLKIINKKKYAIMYDSFGGLQSLLNLLCTKKNLLNDINTKKFSVKDIFISGTVREKFEVILSILGQFIFFPFFIIISLCLATLNKGGTLIYVSRKNAELP